MAKNEIKTESGNVKNLTVKQGGKGEFSVFSVNDKSYCVFDAEIAKTLVEGASLNFEYTESAYMKDGKPMTSRIIRKIVSSGTPKQSMPASNQRESSMVKLGALKDALQYYELYLTNERANGKKIEFSINSVYETAAEFERKITGEEFIKPIKQTTLIKRSDDEIEVNEERVE